MVDTESIRQRAWAAHGAERLAEAETYYRQLLGYQPDERDAINLGALLRRTGRLAEAAALYAAWIERWPQARTLRMNAANCLRELGEPQRALTLVEPELSTETAAGDALESAGKSLLAMGELERCQQVLERLLRLEPGHVDGLMDLGICLSKRGEPQRALVVFEQAQQQAPEDLRLTANRITILVELGELEKAGQLLEAVPLERRCDQLDLLSAEVTLRMARQEMVEALALLERLTREAPGQPGHWLNRAACLRAVKQMVAAHRVLQAGLKRHPDNSELRHAYGQSLAERGQQRQALPLLREAIDRGQAVKQDHLFNLQFLGAGYGLLSAAERRELARGWEARKRRLGPLWPDLMLEPLEGRRLRVGYLSADFCNHPVGRFLLPVLQQHNREAVEVWGLHVGPHHDWITDQLQASCEHWLALRGVPDPLAARVVADQRLDVLVELGGFTGESRLGIVVERPAPVQLSYLGYPAPTYLEAIDGWIGDAVLFSQLEAEDRRQALLEVNGGYMAFAPGELPVPARCNAPRFRFGSFNHARKLTPETITLWLQLLEAVPEAELVLKSVSFGEQAERERVRQLFLQRGLAAERLVLLPWVEGGLNHLQLYRELDVALDPIPYGGATTTAEALWMGVPVLSLGGPGMVGCLSASILVHANCGAWLTDSPEAFVAAGQRLAAAGPRTAEQRLALRQRLEASAFGNPRRLAGELERLYRGISLQRPRL